MKQAGFDVKETLGKLNKGYEIQFEKNDVALDIFWIYPGTYRGKEYFILSSYFGQCDNLPHGTCVYGYRPYNVVRKRFLGNTYNVVPKKTLIDMYGKDYKVPIKYDYYSGQELGHSKGLIKDYYRPKPTDQKIAFCFLLYNAPIHKKIWAKFFNDGKTPLPQYNIYSHIKKVDSNTPKYISRGKVKTIKTAWCEENLVWAQIKMLKRGLADPDNKYFVLLSDNCIPLLTFDETYRKIFSTSKSRIEIDMEHEARNVGLYYASQWTLLTRKHAQQLVNLKESPQGMSFVKKIKQKLCDAGYCLCPDEIYPINWFINLYGKPSTSKFKSQFIDKAPTYTYWDGIAPHPIKFTDPKLQKFKNKICNSGAIFARKFNNKAATDIGMKCSHIKRKSKKKLN